MTIKHILKLCVLLLIFSCASSHISKIEGKRIDIDNSLKPQQEIENFIAPYRAHINKNMDSIISYAPQTYTKSDGSYNTAIGNLMADAVFSESNPVFHQRTQQNIDFAILNHGGIRSIISKGNITIRTAFEVMPFENSVVVVALKGTQIQDMMTYLSKAKRAHPVSHQLQLILDKNSNIKTATVHGKPIDDNKIYYVATNDYLYSGGDGMTFFHPNEGLYVLNYKIRDVLIDNFKKKDTLNPIRDRRFIKLED
ncbi:5'-nucleotidase C-terminal domain-containing protein [Winogradskyella sediminis]|uniref:5'-nucleotidase, C-terminal domain n=1 Tax=Winogradskyella sediminis TaxID=1382466 RepID=A0A1H1M9M6_9FLAO|nr:5'-nucleotidase [Winogradskyella sediminis]REG85937.1 5'-nucleotidase-like protein [Winogradskyella sediminis]SDR82719.1 5'-nucleotidase, C-terminal domain [Winogradskyella sediminis]